MRQWNVWAAAEAKFDRFFFSFFQKAPGTPIPYMDFFWQGPQNFFAPSNWPFFRGTDPFQELRAHSKNWGPRLLEEPGRCCCCGSRAGGGWDINKILHKRERDEKAHWTKQYSTWYFQRQLLHLSLNVHDPFSERKNQGVELCSVSRFLVSCSPVSCGSLSGL